VALVLGTHDMPEAEKLADLRVEHETYGHGQMIRFETGKGLMSFDEVG
jgi:hypothetical protein